MDRWNHVWKLLFIAVLLFVIPVEIVEAQGPTPKAEAGQFKMYDRTDQVQTGAAEFMMHTVYVGYSVPPEGFLGPMVHDFFTCDSECPDGLIYHYGDFSVVGPLGPGSSITIPGPLFHDNPGDDRFIQFFADGELVHECGEGWIVLDDCMWEVPEGETVMELMIHYEDSVAHPEPVIEEFDPQAEISAAADCFGNSATLETDVPGTFIVTSQVRVDGVLVVDETTPYDVEAGSFTHTFDWVLGESNVLYDYSVHAEFNGSYEVSATGNAGQQEICVVPVPRLAGNGLLKVDQDGEVLAGATFAILNLPDFVELTANTNLTSDEDGQIYVEASWFDGVTEFTIEVQETEAPDGYELDDTVYELTLVDGQTGMPSDPIQVENTWIPIPRLAGNGLLKVDQDGEVLAGATFAILNLPDFVELTANTNLTSDEDGQIYVEASWFDGVTEFTIEVQETEAPDGYELDDTVYELTLVDGQTGMPSDPIQVENTWIPVPRLAGNGLLKVDQDGEVLAGATFAILNLPDFVELTANTNLTSDEDGQIYVEASWFDGVTEFTIEVQETEAPDGYELDDTVYELTLVDGQTGMPSDPIQVENTWIPIPRLAGNGLLKVDQDGEVLAGATFAILNLPDFVELTANANLTSDEDGQIYVEASWFDGVTEFTIEVQETEAPDGYERDDTVYELTLVDGQTGMPSDPIQVVNSWIPVPRLAGNGLLKVDQDGEALANATFEILDLPEFVELTANTNLTSDSSGRIYVEAGWFDDVTEFTIRIQETEAPAGYELDDTVYELTLVDGQTGMPSDPIQVENTWIPVPRLAGNGLLKVDQDGEALANATFEILDLPEFVELTANTNLTSDEDGQIYVEAGWFDDVTEFTIRIQETEAPAGYELDDTVYELTLVDGQTGIPSDPIQVENTWIPVPRLAGNGLLKVDQDGEALANATFEILDLPEFVELTANTNLTSDEDGQIYVEAGWFDDVTEFTIRIQETEAPAGYELDDTVYELTLVDGQTGIPSDPIQVENTWIPVPRLAGNGLLKVDQDGEALANATFTILDLPDFVELTANTNLTSDEDGQIYVEAGWFDGVTNFTIRIQETVVPVGYIGDSSVYELTLIDGTVGFPTNPVEVVNTEREENPDPECLGAQASKVKGTIDYDTTISVQAKDADYARIQSATLGWNVVLPQGVMTTTMTVDEEGIHHVKVSVGTSPEGPFVTATECKFKVEGKDDTPKTHQDQRRVVAPESFIEYLHNKYHDNPAELQIALNDYMLKISEAAQVESWGGSTVSWAPYQWRVNPEQDLFVDWAMTGFAEGQDGYGRTCFYDGMNLDKNGVPVSDFGGAYGRRDGTAWYRMIAWQQMKADSQEFGIQGYIYPELQKHYHTWGGLLGGYDDNFYKFDVVEPDPDQIVQDLEHCTNLANMWLTFTGMSAGQKKVADLLGVEGIYSPNMMSHVDIDSYGEHPASHPAPFMGSYFLTETDHHFQVHFTGMKVFWWDPAKPSVQGWYEFSFNPFDQVPWYYGTKQDGTFGRLLNDQQHQRYLDATPKFFVNGDNQVIIDTASYFNWLEVTVELMQAVDVEEKYVVNVPTAVAEKRLGGWAGTGFNPYTRAYNQQADAHKLMGLTIEEAYYLELDIAADKVDGWNMQHRTEALTVSITHANSSADLANVWLEEIGVSGNLPHFEEAYAAFKESLKPRPQAIEIDPNQYWTVPNPPSFPYGDVTFGFDWTRYLEDGGKAKKASLIVHQVKSGESYSSIAKLYTHGNTESSPGTLIRLNGSQELKVGDFIIIGSNAGNYPTVDPTRAPNGKEYLVDQIAIEAEIDLLAGKKTADTGAHSDGPNMLLIVALVVLVIGVIIIVTMRLRARK